jgi:predicted house-cleaning noncanonical NTP pyrophosphatase (MazG superfamily)
MQKIFYNKLIRDKVPANITKAGASYSIKILNAKDFERELIKKVGEEASGLLKAKNKKEIIGELADVLDVIEEIIRIKKIKPTQIIKQQKINSKHKGGFNKRIFLFWSSDDGYKTNEIKYKN